MDLALSRGRKDGVTLSRRPPAVRPDLEQVFRASYARVVAVAARVLGSRDEAEDVAQEVFLAFNRAGVPAAEARGWLSVGRRRYGCRLPALLTTTMRTAASVSPSTG